MALKSLMNLLNAYILSSESAPEVMAKYGISVTKETLKRTEIPLICVLSGQVVAGLLADPYSYWKKVEAVQKSNGDDPNWTALIEAVAMQSADQFDQIQEQIDPLDDLPKLDRPWVEDPLSVVRLIDAKIIQGGLTVQVPHITLSVEEIQGWSCGYLTTLEPLISAQLQA